MRERVLSSCKRTFSRKAFRRFPDLQETTPQAPSCWGIWESEGLALSASAVGVDSASWKRRQMALQLGPVLA